MTTRDLELELKRVEAMGHLEQQLKATLEVLGYIRRSRLDMVELVLAELWASSRHGYTMPGRMQDARYVDLLEQWQRCHLWCQHAGHAPADAVAWMAMAQRECERQLSAGEVA